jgi:hypothetical protein
VTDAFKFFDAYSLRARLFPALIASGAAIVLIAALVPWHRLTWAHAFASIGAIVILYVMADIARRRGRAIEPELIRRMGGLPSTTMLRHRDNTFEAAAKTRWHKFLGGKIGDKAPSAADEQNDPTAADKFYARCGSWLRESTRNHKKFKVLFEENITYGFRRNLLGLKLPAFIIDALIVAVCVIFLWHISPIDWDADLPQKGILVTGVAILHAAFVAAFIGEKTVFEAARTYGRQLVLSCEALQAAAPAKRR